MESRRLGPVVGLGTYGTFLGNELLATDVVTAALGAGTTALRHVADVRSCRGVARRRARRPSRRRCRGDEDLGRVGRRRSRAVRSPAALLRPRRGRSRCTTSSPGAITCHGSRRSGTLDRSTGSASPTGTAARSASSSRRSGPVGSRRSRSRSTRSSASASSGFCPLAEELGIAVLVMRPLGGAEAPTLRRDPGPVRTRAAPLLRGRDLGPGAAEVVPRRSAGRRRPAGDLQARSGDGERRGGARPDVRPGRAPARRAARRSVAPVAVPCGRSSASRASCIVPPRCGSESPGRSSRGSTASR